jgi:putative Mg2+ transporter-C (MgtC) family protein
VKSVRPAQRAFEARELLVQRAEASDYPVGDIEETAKPDDSIRIVARRVGNAVDSNEMDVIVDALGQSDAISDAIWHRVRQIRAWTH